MAKGDLTLKQKRFCEEFLIDLNGTQAAIRAGFSAKTARQQASQMLSNDKVQHYLNELRTEQQQRTQINADAVLNELAIVGFSKITDVLDLDRWCAAFKEELSDVAQRTIQSVMVTKTSNKTDRGVNSTERLQVKLHSKISALEKLGNHFGLFNDFNGAIATLKQYGSIEPTEDGHVYRSGNSSQTHNAGQDDA